MNNKVFVSCAVTGSGDTAKKHPDLPKTPEQIAKAAIEAANEIFELIGNNHTDIQNEYFKNRLERTNLINKRSKFNYFGYHISNPLVKILRNELLKRLVKNKNFIHSYLGKVYK